MATFSRALKVAVAASCAAGVLATLHASIQDSESGSTLKGSAVIARAAVDHVTVQIGERVVLSLNAELAVAPLVAQPVLGTTLGRFEIVSVETLTPQIERGRWIGRWNVTLTTFEAGAWEVPGVVINVRWPDGRSAASIPTEAIGLRVTLPSVRAEDAPRPLSPPMVEPEIPRRPVSLATWITALLLAAAAIVVFCHAPTYWRRARRRSQWRRLERALADLTGMSAATQEDATRKYSQVSGILRQGISDLLGEPVGALTSSDLARLVGRDGDKVLVAGLDSVLGVIDEIRFGGAIPTPQTDAQLRRLAVAVFQRIVSAANEPGASQA